MDWFSPLTTVFSTLIGFVSGWGLFELTEWRKRREAQQELFRALVPELESAEVLASHNVVKYARFFLDEPEESDFPCERNSLVPKSWPQANGGFGRCSEASNSSLLIAGMEDRQLVELFAHIDETVGTKLIFPIVDGVLGGKTAGLNARQIAALGMVRWHAHLLSNNADAMKEFLRMSFTVQNDNHARIVVNHEKQRKSYALRAEVLLGVTRQALKLLRDEKGAG